MNIGDMKIFNARTSHRVSIIHINHERKVLDLDDSFRVELQQISQLRLINNKLYLNDIHANDRFQRKLSEVLNAEPLNVDLAGGYINIPSTDSDSILISVFPFQNFAKALSSSYQNEFYNGLAQVRVTYHRPTNLAVFSRAMHELYSLSASESRVVSLLVQGLNTKEIADCLHVADSTLRTHLKRIFSKTETRHQAELVSKILLRDTYVIPNIFS